MVCYIYSAVKLIKFSYSANFLRFFYHLLPKNKIKGKKKHCSNLRNISFQRNGRWIPFAL